MIVFCIRQMSQFSMKLSLKKYLLWAIAMHFDGALNI